MAGLTPFVCKVGTSTYLSFNLDKNIYDTTIAAAVGLSVTEAPAGSSVLYTTQKQARRSGLVQVLRVGVVRGKKRRQVTLLCDKEKAASVVTALKGKKINLGLGIGVEWDIVTVGT